MKIFISLIVGVLCFAQMSAQEHYYYYKGEKIYLELNPDYIFISSTEESSIQNAQINISVDNNNSTEMTEDRVSQTLSKPVGFVEQHPVRHWREINLTDNLSQANYLAEIQQLRADNSKLVVSPYFQKGSTDKIGLSNYFYVKLRHQDDFNLLLDRIETHQVELVGYNKFMPLWFTLSVTPSTSNAMQMANLFYETGLFQHAEPDLMVDVLLNDAQSPSNTAFVPNDPFYSDQWHLNNTGQNGGIAGIDINAEDAWDITLGNNAVVAVLDHGFEMNHPDLVNNTIGTGYDTDSGSSPSVIWGPHGTACAGIVGAEGNNNEGVSGVAPNTGLVSISNRLVISPTIKQELANGINWAWQNGADVISNSWGHNSLVSSLIDDAITNALTNGRGGLGAVVVFATGNFDGTVAYPANSNPDILAVGAMSPCGERKNPGSCDNETWWGSNFGNELDIISPGVLIPTTDRQGDIADSPLTCSTWGRPLNDYNPDICLSADYPNLDYYSRFNGTSSACPIVAGVAALVLSVNPNLTAQQVNDIIEQSAQKTRTDLYTYQTTANRPNGTWNNEMGYGLVDAYQAVLLTQQQGCPSDITHSGTINSGDYEASNSIVSTTTIGSNQDVIYDAGNFISLEPAFLADASNGSTFFAVIDGCGGLFLVNETSNTDNPIVYVMENAEERLANDELVTFKNYPNPFTGQTTIEFTLVEDALVTLFVSDVMGRQIAVLLQQESKSEGTHHITFDGNNYPAGMYYYTIQAGEYIGTQKMTLIK